MGRARRVGDVSKPRAVGRRARTDLVCFSVNWDRDREFLEAEIRSVPPGILTVIGGRHATEDPEQWLTRFPNVDAVIRGAGAGRSPR